MPNIWYHTPKYGNETWVPKKLCDNAYCLYGDEVGRSSDIVMTYVEHGRYWEEDRAHYKCNHCGHTWKEEFC